MSRSLSRYRSALLGAVFLAATAPMPFAWDSAAAAPAQAARPVPTSASMPRAAGDHLAAPDLRSSSVVVVDQDSGEVLLEKNPDKVMSIASISKLMTAMVTLDAHLPADEILGYEATEHAAVGPQSRLRAGATLTRSQALQLALMASENGAAQLLARTYPGGVPAAVAAMNAKARALGMTETHFDDPTGLSPQNQSTAGDLVKMVEAAYRYELIREYSVARELSLPLRGRMIRFANTNRLTARTDWDIGLQKTGYISAAGRCLVMQATVARRHVVMVFLDSWGKYSRLGDAQRVRQWLERRGPVAGLSSVAGEKPSPVEISLAVR